jgi:alcohol dehydrogenase (cytochrome c)
MLHLSMAPQDSAKGPLYCTIAASLLFLCLNLLGAQQSVSVQAPVSGEVAAGAVIFRAHCAPCHGIRGEGGRGPDLRKTSFRHGSTDADLLRIISKGIPGTEMPGIFLPESEIRRIIQFIRSLPPVLVRGKAALPASPPVTYERLLRADREPENWLMYSGNYNGNRFSSLDQITTENVARLRFKWAYQMKTVEKVEATPLVVDSVMYLTEPPNAVSALDAGTGRPLWTYRRSLPEKINVCCGQVNRGLAILGDRLFVGTLDAHLLALDRNTGSVIWDVAVADYRMGYSITAAPLAVKNTIVTGIAGGEYGIRGFVDGYDAGTGKHLWRFNAIPGPGEPGHDGWVGESWKTGGGPSWLTGSFDPELNTIYWGIGNPAPDWNGAVRPGDNSYSNCVVALDADTGKLKWYFQFTPHDVHDWDAVQIPVLVDALWQGRPRRLLYWANRNAFFYVLDRESGEFLLAKPFVRQTWAGGINQQGRPMPYPGSDPTARGTLVYPGVQGATNWYSPSYSPLTRLFYLSVWDYATRYQLGDAVYSPGNRYAGSVPVDIPEDPGAGSIRAINPQTGAVQWEHKLPSKPQSGVLSTRGGLVFGGINEGEFFALDAQTGREVWHANTGGMIAAGPITYLERGRQLVSVAAGSSIFTFGLDE